MKAKIFTLVLLTVLVLSAFAQEMEQHPAPLNFDFHTDYVSYGHGGYPCGDRIVYEYDYCSKFWWNKPDLSGTELQIKGYNLYYWYHEKYVEEPDIKEEDIPLDEGKLLLFKPAETEHTHAVVIFATGIVGATWVTAVYSDDAESAPSNIQIATQGFPIEIPSIAGKSDWIYNSQTKHITLNNPANIKSVTVYRVDGLIATSFTSPVDATIDLQSLQYGIYIVKIVRNDSTSESAKIIVK